MINNIVSKILDLKGIPESEREEFLSEKPKLTFDPFLIPDMEEGTELILKHAKINSKIAIYGDYDVDGITSTSLMYICLSELTNKENISFIIPSRFEGGYSLNCDAIKEIYDSGVKLLITVDCGSTSIEEVKYAKSLGLDILLTDHHNIGEEMPECLLINPKRSDSNYPFKELAGVGVAYKVLLALAKKGYISQKVKADVLDLVLLGTVADVVPLVSENRTLVKYGLKVLVENRRKGLRKLIESSQLNLNNFVAGDLSYKVIPKINALGRVTNATDAVNLMLSNDDTEIERIVSRLNEVNVERQIQQDEAYKYALHHALDENGNCPNFIVMTIDDCNEGVLGIVAGKIKDVFNRPTILLTKSKEMEGSYKGSGRSIDNIDIHEILSKRTDLFTKFGGHSKACGLTIDEKNIEAVKELGNSEIEKLKKENPEIFKKKETFDLVIEKEDINVKNARDLRAIEPCGKENETPRFKVENVKFNSKSIFGKDNKHLKLYFGNIECIYYGKGDSYNKIDIIENTYNMIGEIKLNEWNGNIKTQFFIQTLTKL